MIQTYRAIVADPPWKYKNRSVKGLGKNPCNHYTCLTVEQIAALSLREIVTEDAILFLWVTGPFLDRAKEVARGWGFAHFSGKAFTWVKQSPTGKSWHFGTGYWTRKNSEDVWLFTRDVKPKRKNADVAELLIAPRGKHSAKPEEMQTRVERLVDGPYLELFARRERPGWTCLGNEISGNDIAEDLRALALQPSLSLELH